MVSEGLSFVCWLCFIRSFIRFMHLDLKSSRSTTVIAGKRDTREMAHTGSQMGIWPRAGREGWLHLLQMIKKKDWKVTINEITLKENLYLVRRTFRCNALFMGSILEKVYQKVAGLHVNNIRRQKRYGVRATQRRQKHACQKIYNDISSSRQTFPSLNLFPSSPLYTFLTEPHRFSEICQPWLNQPL